MVPVGYMLENFLGSRHTAAVRTFFAGVAIILAAAVLSCGAAYGQVAPLLKTDINSGAAGSYSFSSPTYTVSGAGAGIGTAGSGTASTTDGFTFASFPVSGNIEIVGKLTGQSGGTTNFSQAGLMVRSTLASNSQMFFIGASPTDGNGINFHARTTTGATSASTLGQAPGAAPVWLRIVISGQNIASYQSSDSTNWVLVGKAKATLPAAFHAGLAVSSNQHSTTSTATFENVRIITNVPQRSADMLLWLRSDDGLQSTDKLNKWLDVSGNGRHAVGTGTSRPTVSTNAISGSPVVQFTPGNSEFLALPSGFNDFAQGASIYIVMKHAGSSARYVLDLATGASIHDSIGIEQVTNTDMQFVVGDSLGSYAVVTGNGFSTSSFQLLEATDSPYDEVQASTGNLYRNGVLKGTNTAFVGITPNMERTKNELGRSYLDTLHYSGQLAELILINKEDTASARQQVERYCQSKYGFGVASSTLTAPVISPSNRVLTSGPVSITITADPGTAILYTTDGTSDPSSSTIGGVTSVYTGSFDTSSSIKIKAMSVGIGFANSAIASSDIQIDANASRIYKNDLKFWVRADNGVVLGSGTAVAKLFDVSGGGHVFEQATATKQPSLLTGQTPSGLPAIDFPATSNQHLKSTSNFNSWSGASIFMVVSPTQPAPSGSPRMLDIGNGTTAQDNLGLNQPAGTDYRFFAYDGTTLKNCTHTGGFTQSQFQLLSATTDNTELVATVFKNGVQGAQTTAFSVLQNVTRASNCIGANSAGTGPFKGKIAEIIVYSRKLTDAERQDVQGFLISRHQIQVSPPVIMPNIGMNSPTTVTLTVDTGAQAYYTVDGTAPTAPPTGTTITYTGPFAISGPTRVRAIARNFSTNSTVSEAYIAVDAAAANVPRNGVQVWLRSDHGVVAPSGNPPQITSWKDIISATRDATATNNPTLLSNVLNGLPAVNINGGSTQYFTNGGTFNFTGGFSAFIVSNITTPGSTVDIATFTQTSPVRSVKIQATSTPSLLYSVTNGSTQTLTTGMTLGFPQLIEVVHSGGTATVFRNGAQLNSGSVAASTYAGGLTGQISSSGAASTQQVFEVIFYDRAVTSQERQDIEAYLMQRHAIAFAPVAEPVFSIPTGTTFEAPTQVSVAGPLNATIRYTTDGSSPNLSSPILSSPINISHTQTLKAIAVLNNVASNIVSASYTLDLARWPNPNAGGTSSPTINLQLPTTSQ